MPSVKKQNRQAFRTKITKKDFYFAFYFKINITFAEN